MRRGWKRTEGACGCAEHFYYSRQIQPGPATGWVRRCVPAKSCRREWSFKRSNSKSAEMAQFPIRESHGPSRDVRRREQLAANPLLLMSRIAPLAPFSVGALANRTTGRTATAVEQQIAAMGFKLLEVGLYDPAAGGRQSVIIPRVWDAGTIIRSVPWLRHQNCEGRNIYVRP